MLTITDLTRVILADDCGLDTPITLAEFFEANDDGIEAEEQVRIRRSLATGGFYQSGGGAQPVWTLTTVPSHDELTAIYQAYVEAEGLPKLSADDQDPATLDPEQVFWIDLFCKRWDAA